MIKKGKKLKLTQYIQIYKNNDPLSEVSVPFRRLYSAKVLNSVCVKNQNNF